MNMRKKICLLAVAALMVVSATACGNEVKEISKDVSAEQPGGASDGTGENGAVSGTVSDALKGYIFEAEGTDGTVSITTDIEMAPVLEKLGEPVKYFEAASCAFQGLDKVYTYQHFEIDTYPDGDKDIISSIILKDDLIETPEGLCIGMSKADMESVYGTDYEEKGNMCVYTKDGMHLSVLVENGVITSIEYGSAVLDTAN